MQPRSSRALAAGALALAALGSSAHARDVHWSVGIHAAPAVTLGVGNVRPWVVAPPVYYAPAPMYVQPQPVYHVQPQPIYYVQPPVYYVEPAPVYHVYPRHRGHHGHGHWHHHHRHHHGHH